MSKGFYKRRRGALEHIEAGAIDLLDDGIHDYLSMKANLVIGSGYKLPAGVVMTSAVALHSRCKCISERTIQRRLNHMEEIGWLKFSPWRIPGKRGNYPVVICRASVHDLSGNEYRVNGQKTIDWHCPVYEPVDEVSVSRPLTVGEVSGNRELEKREEREAEVPAAFSSIGFDAPFGHPKFRTIWLEEFAKDAEWLTIKMESAIQRCQQESIGVPPQFFSAKRQVEADENAIASAKYRRTPL